LLKEKTDAYPGYRAVQALCTDEDGRRFKFHVASNGGQSSSVFEPDLHLKAHPGVVFENTIEISSVTLDSLMDSLQKETPDEPLPVYDLLCMDTQGCELLVLKGAQKTLKNVRAVWTEVSWTELYKGGVLLNELSAYLEQMGFIMVGLSMNRNLWGDALFIRRNGQG
jgi:FkbM family methyltransferase